MLQPDAKRKQLAFLNQTILEYLLKCTVSIFYLKFLVEMNIENIACGDRHSNIYLFSFNSQIQ